ncbi:hypothetical protein DPMN_070610 [Dreissena polymorpha]|uniref:Uncharacterized protein n=1 Tax=Dreissena polymorpha TaxID=45954 RepID=A0A9D4BV82_DREPO|nr:hypothetical protein DPMN_070610 [Dreissena polymorpha]
MRVPRVSRTVNDHLSEQDLVKHFPASELLSQIHFDHVYTLSSVPQADGSGVNSNAANPVPTEFCGFNSRGRPRNTDSDMPALDAESIQTVFQNMLNMTALSTILDTGFGSASHFDQDKSLKIKSVVLDSSSEIKETIGRELVEKGCIKQEICDNLDKHEVENATLSMQKSLEIKKNAKTRKSKKTSTVTNKHQQAITDKNICNTTTGKVNIANINKGPSDSSGGCKKVNKSEWTTARRLMEAEHELNTLLRYTARLLVRRWGEYLTMSRDQMSMFELSSAREADAAQEVLEMLEDKDRYVWQLIDELSFF